MTVDMQASLDLTKWIIKLIRTAVREQCEHLPRPSGVAFVAGNKPGHLLCADCLADQMDDPAQKCDRCGGTSPNLVPWSGALGTVVAVTRICRACTIPVASPKPPRHERRRRR